MLPSTNQQNKPMYTALLHIHSILRYAILLFLLAAIVKSFSGWFGKKQFAEGDRKIFLFTFISAHTQLLVGLILYFMKGWHSQMGDMSNAVNRFWSLEHMVMMIISIGLITRGYLVSKKASADETKYKSVAIFFLIALLLICLAIPWPFRIEGIARGWMPGM